MKTQSTMQRVLLAALALAASLILFGASRAEAFPELVRHGYFSCTSCHVSPGGGGVLTPYGRSIAAEKLSTWTYKDEEAVGHGALPKLPDWLLVGGDFRQIQTYVDTARARSGRYIAMQRDVEICGTGTLGPVLTGCVTAGSLPKTDPSADLQYGVRKAYVRADFGEHVALRAGRFYPRFGLMIPNHTSPVRAGLGYAPNGETDQIETTYLSETLELTASYDFGRGLDLGTELEALGTVEPAYGFSFATLLGTSSRAGASYRHRGLKDGVEHDAGLFAALGLDPKNFILAEVDQKAVVVDDEITRSAVSHLKFGHEIHQGVVLATVHEVDFKDLRDGATRADTYGLDLQWFPRPHLELEAFVGQLLQRRDFSYATAAYLMMHYYL